MSKERVAEAFETYAAFRSLEARLDRFIRSLEKRIGPSPERSAASTGHLDAYRETEALRVVQTAGRVMKAERHRSLAERDNARTAYREHPLPLETQTIETHYVNLEPCNPTTQGDIRTVTTNMMRPTGHHPTSTSDHGSASFLSVPPYSYRPRETRDVATETGSAGRQAATVEGSSTQAPSPAHDPAGIDPQAFDLGSFPIEVPPRHNFLHNGTPSPLPPNASSPVRDTTGPIPLTRSIERTRCP